MRVNKKLFWVMVLALAVTCVFAQQKTTGEFQISGQQVYDSLPVKKTAFDASVAFGGTAIGLGSIKKGILTITLPAITETGDKVYEWMSISFPNGPGAGLSLLNLEGKDIVHFKFKQAEKKWVFISVKTGTEETLENLYKAGYIWYAGQELPFAPPQRQVSESDLIGIWKGSYVAGQGETALVLTVYEENGRYIAIFDFFNLPGKSHSEEGKYYMNVSYNISREKFYLKGVEWIEHPAGYNFADLDGTITGNVFSGFLSGSNYTFRVVKQ